MTNGIVGWKYESMEERDAKLKNILNECKAVAL
jgi:hypothetical protein